MSSWYIKCLYQKSTIVKVFFRTIKCVLVVRASFMGILMCVYLQQQTHKKISRGRAGGKEKGVTSPFYTLLWVILIGSTGAYVMSVFEHGDKWDLLILISRKLHNNYKAAFKFLHWSCMHSLSHKKTCHLLKHLVHFMLILIITNKQNTINIRWILIENTKILYNTHCKQRF